MHRRWGTGHVFQFLTFKLLDLQADPEALMSQPNPFATVAEAHLAALTTRRDAELRFSEKVRLVRRLYEGGLSGDNIRTLFNVIDYLIRLAPDSVGRFRAVHHQIEEERNVRVLTQSEELALEEGRVEGREEGRDEGRIETLLALVEARFGTLPESLEARLHGISADGLRGLVRTAVSARDLPAFLKELDRMQSKSEHSG